MREKPSCRVKPHTVNSNICKENGRVQLFTRMAGGRFIENPIWALIFLRFVGLHLGWQSHRDPAKAKPFDRVVKAPPTGASAAMVGQKCSFMAVLHPQARAWDGLDNGSSVKRAYDMHHSDYRTRSFPFLCRMKLREALSQGVIGVGICQVLG